VCHSACSDLAVAYAGMCVCVQDGFYHTHGRQLHVHCTRRFVRQSILRGGDRPDKPAYFCSDPIRRYQRSYTCMYHTYSLEASRNLEPAHRTRTPPTPAQCGAHTRTHVTCAKFTMGRPTLHHWHMGTGAPQEAGLRCHVTRHSGVSTACRCVTHWQRLSPSPGPAWYIHVYIASTMYSVLPDRAVQAASAPPPLWRGPRHPRRAARSAPRRTGYNP